MYCSVSERDTDEAVDFLYFVDEEERQQYEEENPDYYTVESDEELEPVEGYDYEDDEDEDDWDDED